jgi:hypothetical protein
MLSSTNAVTEPPRVNIPRIGERVKAASNTPKIMNAVNALDRNNFLETGMLVPRRFVDDKVDLLTLLLI